MLTVRAEVKGLKELGDKLRTLSEKVQKRSLRNAARAGAVVVQRQAAALAPKDTGLLAKSIIVKRSNRESKLGREVFKVGIKSTVKKYVNNAKNQAKKRVGKKYGVTNQGPVYYGRFVEFGTSKMSPRPFLAPAFDSKKQDAVTAIKDKLASEINRP